MPNTNVRHHFAMLTVTTMTLSLVLSIPALPTVRVEATGIEQVATGEQTRRSTPGSRLAEQLRVYEGQRRPLPLERGARITLSTKDADLVEVLRAFARLAGVNLVLDPSVRGKVTVELFDVPWEDALRVILATHGLGAELDGRVWRIE